MYGGGNGPSIQPMASNCWAQSRPSLRFGAILRYRLDAEDVVGTVDWRIRHARNELASHPRLPPRLEQGADRRPEATALAKTRLGDPGPPRDR